MQYLVIVDCVITALNCIEDINWNGIAYDNRPCMERVTAWGNVLNSGVARGEYPIKL